MNPFKECGCAIFLVDDDGDTYDHGAIHIANKKKRKWKYRDIDSHTVDHIKVKVQKMIGFSCRTCHSLIAEDDQADLYVKFLLYCIYVNEKNTNNLLKRKKKEFQQHNELLTIAQDIQEYIDTPKCILPYLFFSKNLTQLVVGYLPKPPDYDKYAFLIRDIYSKSNISNHFVCSGANDDYSECFTYGKLIKYFPSVIVRVIADY